jgi:hypothetical protein
MNRELIAPCGMNCALCAAYLARKYGIKGKGVRMTSCEGCRPRNKKCAFLKKRCEVLLNNEIRYCYECNSFPCQRLKTIDKRYQTKFHMSMIHNLTEIKQRGVDQFLTEQRMKWRCPCCGGIVCCHNGLCFKCDFDKLQQKKRKYSWEEK